MTLIDATGAALEDPWRYPIPDDDYEQHPRGVVYLRDWELYRSRFGQEAAGVWVPGDQDIAAVAPLLAQVELVVIEFPKSRDGRGFTLARVLRERHHFRGDVRAAGPLLPDQFSMLLQCGYTSLISPPSVPLVRWREAAAALRITRPRTLLERLSRNGSSAASR